MDKEMEFHKTFLKAKINIKAGVRPKPASKKEPRKELILTPLKPIKLSNENEAYEIIVRKKGVESVTEIQVPKSQKPTPMKRLIQADADLPECCRPKKTKKWKKGKYRDIYILEKWNQKTKKYDVRMRSNKAFPPSPPHSESVKCEEIKDEAKPSTVSRDCATSPTPFGVDMLSEFKKVLARNLPNTEFSFACDQPSVPDSQEAMANPIQKTSDPLLSAFEKDINSLEMELLVPADRNLEETLLDEEYLSNENSELQLLQVAGSNPVFSAVTDAQKVLLADCPMVSNLENLTVRCTVSEVQNKTSAISVVPASELMNGEYLCKQDSSMSTLLTPPPETTSGAEYSPTPTSFGKRSADVAMQNYFENYSHFEMGTQHSKDNFDDIDLSFLDNL